MQEADYQYDKVNIVNDPYIYAMRTFFNRWKPFIVRAIGFDGTTRFNRFTKQMPITEKVLAQNLRELESDGIIIRRIYSEEMPIRVEYYLTESGESLCKLLDQIYDWSWNEMKIRNLPIDPLGEMWHGYREPDKDLMHAPNKTK